MLVSCSHHDESSHFRLISCISAKHPAASSQANLLCDPEAILCQRALYHHKCKNNSCSSPALGTFAGLLVSPASAQLHHSKQPFKPAYNQGHYNWKTGRASFYGLDGGSTIHQGAQQQPFEDNLTSQS
jgi:hypothetical protein